MERRLDRVSIPGVEGPRRVAFVYSLWEGIPLWGMRATIATGILLKLENRWPSLKVVRMRQGHRQAMQGFHGLCWDGGSEAQLLPRKDLLS